MERPIGKWTNRELIAELNKVGARTDGRKAQLVERLEDYRRNSNFAGPSIVAPEDLDMPVFPDISLFRSLTVSAHDECPPIRKEHVEEYCLYRQVADRNANGDNRAVLRGEIMLKGNTVDALSFHTSDKNMVYLTGIINAEMKGSLNYPVKIILDCHGAVLNSKCDCPVGHGPHSTCKHITAALLMLVEFKATKVLRVNQSCTETLQTFQQPKKRHKSSPVKAQNLGTGINENIDVDPRKPQYRNRPSYNDEVKNLTTNFVSSSGIDVNMRYTVKKADLFTASQDHDYLKIPFTQY